LQLPLTVHFCVWVFARIIHHCELAGRHEIPVMAEVAAAAKCDGKRRQSCVDFSEKFGKRHYYYYYSTTSLLAFIDIANNFFLV
jgi:hypothetical protein